MRVYVALRWWHVLAFMGILAWAAAVMFFVPTWVGCAAVIVAPVLCVLIARDARHLMAVQASQETPAKALRLWQAPILWVPVVVTIGAVVFFRLVVS